MPSNTNINNEGYETDDIYLAAYLKLCGCVMDNRRRVGTKVIFMFSNPAGVPVSELRDQYYSGAQGKLYDYAHEIMRMKQLCF